MTLSRIHFTSEFYFLAASFLNLRRVIAAIVEIMLVHNGMFVSIHGYIETIIF